MADWLNNDAEMKVQRTNAGVLKNTAEAIVVGVYSDHRLAGSAAKVDKASGGLLKKLIDSGEFSGKPNEVVPLYSVAGLASPLVVAVGLGSQEKFNRSTAFRAAGAASRNLAAKKRKQVAFYLGDGWTEDQHENGVAGAIVGCHGQDLYRAEKKRYPFESLEWSGAEESTVNAGAIQGQSVNLTRRLVNEPPQEIYPESFAQVAGEVAGSCGLAIEVWDEHRLEREQCGSLLGVAKGSARPPRLVILRYAGGKSGQPPLAYVGKGVTFDSGGLSLKTSDGMKTMKCDMAGAATVLGAMQAIARLKLPINAVGLMGLVENMPSGTAMKLGDVLHARNGRTIEVLNTDAEGRLVLADVLDVAVGLGAARIIDLATLTGACVVALGNDVGGAMTNDDGWCNTVLEAAKTCGEALWQLPMFGEYGEMIKSDVADIKNIGDGRSAGAITAAKFLEEFVGQTPWTHLDIAGPAFSDKPQAWIDGGASGVFVRTLIEVARRWSERRSR